MFVAYATKFRRQVMALGLQMFVAYATNICQMAAGVTHRIVGDSRALERVHLPTCFPEHLYAPPPRLEQR